MKKYLLGVVIVVAAIIAVSFTVRSNKHVPVKEKKLDYELFQFNGAFGDEDEYDQYDWVESAPTGCSNSGSVCYILALRASEDDQDPDYLHPQFNISGGFPDVDFDKVMSLTQKQGPIK